MKLNKLVLMTGLFLSVTILAGTGVIADNYPSKDVMHIIPWSAGGGTDATMRKFMHYAEEKLGVKIFNKNITGAQSGIGVLKLQKSPSDGYTVGTVTWDSIITVPYYKLVPGYDVANLSYLGTVTLHSTALVVPANSPWKTLDDFIAAAKKAPGKYTISNVGTGGVWHLPALDMASKVGIDIRHIPYPKGAAPQREALLSGETDAACMSLSGAFPSVKAGKARVLAVMANHRDEMIPDVPTFKELGHDVAWGSFRMLAIPKDAPQAAKDKLEKAFGEVFTDPEFNKWSKESGTGAVWMNAKETTAFISTIQTKAFALIDDLIKRGLLKPKK